MAESSGSDVVSLQEELVRLGRDLEVSGTYDSATQSVVSDIFRDAGVESWAGDLPASSVIWLPAPTNEIKDCPLRPGAMSTQGVEYATVGGSLVSAVALLPEDAAPGPRTVSIAEISAPIGDDGVISDESFLAAVAAESRLAGDVETPSNELGPEIQVTATLTEPVELTVVPPGSLYSLGASVGCVDTEEGTRQVEVVASSLGKTLVRFTDDSAPPLSVDVSTEPRSGGCG